MSRWSFGTEASNQSSSSSRRRARSIGSGGALPASTPDAVPPRRSAAPPAAVAPRNRRRVSWLARMSSIPVPPHPAPGARRGVHAGTIDARRHRVIHRPSRSDMRCRPLSRHEQGHRVSQRRLRGQTTSTTDRCATGRSVVGRTRLRHRQRRATDLRSADAAVHRRRPDDHRANRSRAGAAPRWARPDRERLGLEWRVASRGGVVRPCNGHVLDHGAYGDSRYGVALGSHSDPTGWPRLHGGRASPRSTTR